MPTKLKFKKGDRVFYAILGKVYFIGTVQNTETKKGLKPYTVKADDDGHEYYANEAYLYSYVTPERAEDFLILNYIKMETTILITMAIVFIGLPVLLYRTHKANARHSSRSITRSHTLFPSNFEGNTEHRKALRRLYASVVDRNQVNTVKDLKNLLKWKVITPEQYQKKVTDLAGKLTEVL